MSVLFIAETAEHFYNQIMKFILLIVSLNLLLACSTNVTQQTPIAAYKNYDRKHLSHPHKGDFISLPQPEKYSICYEHSCAKYATISLNDQQWQKVRSLFNPPTVNAEEERSQIRQAIAILERFTGEQAGTSIDLGENIDGLGMRGQMDCIDESTNSTVYLRMLHNDGLLRWHQQATRISRGFFTGLMSMPHSTAVIQDKSNLKKYAVDSWFLANGKEPFIVPLEDWKAGWKPQ